MCLELGVPRKNACMPSATQPNIKQRKHTLPKTNIDPDNGPLEDCFPLYTNQWFSGSMLVFQGIEFCPRLDDEMPATMRRLPKIVTFLWGKIPPGSGINCGGKDTTDVDMTGL